MNWPALKEKLDLYERLMRLDKPTHGVVSIDFISINY
jgi:hypothetical protein